MRKSDRKPPRLIGESANSSKTGGLEIRGVRVPIEPLADLSLMEIPDERQIELKQQAENRRQDLLQLLQYNPWGKPGGGAPMESIKKQKFLETDNPEKVEAIDTFFAFGRPGHGAPQRTKSGRLRTQLIGDPAIRFGDVQNVNKSVENMIRYFDSREAQNDYRSELDSMVQSKRTAKLKEIELEKLKEEQHLQSNRNRNPFGRRRGPSLPRTVPETNSIFTSTSPRNLKLEEISGDNNDYGYDPWGKGFGTPVRDKFGNSIRSQSPFSVYDNVAKGMTIPMGQYSGGDGSPHMKKSSELVTRLPRTLEKEGVKDLQDDCYPPENLSTNEQYPRTKEGQTFLEKLGWTEDAEHAAKAEKGRQIYLQHLKNAIEDNSKSRREEKLSEYDTGIDLVQLMREKKVGKPRRDSSTGLLADNKLSSTDITKRKQNNLNGDKFNTTEYKNSLTQQAEERHLKIKLQKELDQLETLKHFEVWDSFWSRPGHGAPKRSNNHRKEGIENLCKPRRRVAVLNKR